jgi:GcrA cell cycle regulator
MAQPSWWTDERVDELRTRLSRGESGTEICVAMQAVSRNAVVGKAYRLKLVRPANFVKVAKSARVRRPANSRPAIRKAKPAVADEPALAVFENRKTLMELQFGDCRWPGDGRGIDMLYCGAPTLNGRAYCLAHCRIAFDGKPRSLPKAPRR